MLTKRMMWDEYFMKMADLASSRSTCLRRKVGAVFVRDNHLLVTGYNGPPHGFPHCGEVGCYRHEHNIPPGERHELCRAIHAEQNGIIQAAIHGVSLVGSTVYCTHFPCSICAKMLINVGVRRLVYDFGYPDDFSRSLIDESSIECIHLSMKEE